MEVLGGKESIGDSSRKEVMRIRLERGWGGGRDEDS